MVLKTSVVSLAQSDLEEHFSWRSVLSVMVGKPENFNVLTKKLFPLSIMSPT